MTPINPVYRPRKFPALLGHSSRKLTSRLQESLQQALEDYRTECSACGLVMHRHHRYPRSIMTGCGEVRLRIPVFRCGQCREMSSGMGLLGEEEWYCRYSNAGAQKNQ